MNLDNQLLFLVSALGGVNGLFLSLYFLLKTPRNLSNLLLAGLLLMISIRIIKSVFFYFNPDLSRIFLQLGLTACFFIGPFCFFYQSSRLDKLNGQWLNWRIHLGLLALLSLMVGFAYPYQTAPEAWTVIFKVIMWQWLGYLLLSTLVAKEFIINAIKTKSLDAAGTMTMSVLAGVWLIWAAFFFSSYTSYIAGALSFSFIIYLSGFVAVMRRRKIQEHKPAKYADKKIQDNEAQVLINKLDTLMREEELYKNANLTMPTVAKRMGILTQRLSQLLNDNLNISFPLYINQLRIDAAKSMLSGEKAMKMDDIAEQCGFNSNSTFYTAFKRSVKMTPAKFRDQQAVNHTPD